MFLSSTFPGPAHVSFDAYRNHDGALTTNFMVAIKVPAPNQTSGNPPMIPTGIPNGLAPRRPHSVGRAWKSLTPTADPLQFFRLSGRSSDELPERPRDCRFTIRLYRPIGHPGLFGFHPTTANDP